jgi:polar amino acid transport system substrate-binding protein
MFSKFASTLFFAIVLFVTNSLVYAAKMQVLTSDEPPTNFIENNILVGISVDVVNGIIAITDPGLEISVMPWARAYDMAVTQPNVALFTAGRTPQREKLFHWVGPLTTRAHALYKKQGNSLEITKEDDLRKVLQIGVMVGDWREKFFLSKGFTNIRSLPDHVSSLRMLMSGRVDLWVSSDLEAPMHVKQIGIEPSNIEIAYVIKHNPSYIMLSKGTDLKTVEAWQQAYASLQADGTIAKIAAKWSDKLNIDLIADPVDGLTQKYE